ncbi:MAG: hypothetical protein PHV85_08445, partial [Desulfovibrionaceae bacterium]|nr:hypothetical protein [Desulfovibrionaceae bacterium]
MALFSAKPPCLALCLLVAALFACVGARAEPPQGQAKSLALELKVNGPDGGRILEARLAAEVGFRDGAVALAAQLRDAGLSLPWLFGPVLGAARALVKGRAVELESMDLRMPGARLGLGGQNATLDINLRARGRYLPDKGLLVLDSFSLGLGPHAVSGSLKLARSGSGWSASGELKAVKSPFLPLGLAGIRAGFSLAGDASGVRLRELELRAAETELRASAEATSGPEGLAIRNIDIRVPGAGRVSGRALFPRKGPAQVRLDGPALDLAGLAPLAARLIGLDHAGWTFGGAASLGLRLDDGLCLDLGLRKASFASPEGRYLAQGLEASAEARLGSGAWSRLKLDLGPGEVLAGTRYLDLAAFPLRLAARARKIGPRAFELKDLDLDWGGLGRVSARGRLAATEDGVWSHSGRVQVSGAGLEGLFRTLFSDPLASGPVARAFGLAQVEADFSGQGKELRLKGRLKVSGAGFEDQKNQILVHGLCLDLPLEYVFNAVDPVQETEARERVPGQWGALRCAGLSLPHLAVENIALGVALAPDLLAVDGEISAPVFGGVLRLRPLAVHRPLSGDFRVECLAGLAGLDLSLLPGRVPLEGSLSGDIGLVSLDANRLSVQGGLRGELWGGELTVDRIACDRPLSPARTLAGEAAVRGMDLESLSRALGVGRVTGRLDLEVRDLRLAFGQPESFSLIARSAPQRGVDQTVSLKAVNSLSVIGTGSGLGGVGVGIFARFFKEFSYKSIGLACTLKNDLFRVR